MTTPSERVFLLPPAWVALDGGESLEVVDFADGTSIEVSGVLREEILRSPNGGRPALETMARIDPAMERLRAALAGVAWLPLDRASALRGAGFHQLFLELTSRCNERCVHCYAESGPERGEVLAIETIEEVLADARALGFRAVQLTGGDPLLHPRCAEAAERAAALGLNVEVYTNGLALEGALYERLRAAGVSFAFSFYASDAAVHDAVTRTPGSHRRTVRAIRRAREDGLQVRVAVIVMDENREQLDETLRFLTGPAMGLPEDAVGVDVRRAVGRGVYSIDRAAVPVRPAGTVHARRSDTPLRGRAAVAPDGTVYPCIFSRMFPLGNVREERLSAILGRPSPLRVERKRVLAGRDRFRPQLACMDCRLRASLLDPGLPRPREAHV